MATLTLALVKLWSQQYNDSAGPAAGVETNEGGSQEPFTQEQDEKGANLSRQLVVYVYVQYVYVCEQDPEACVGAARSVSAAGRRAGLVEAHGFTQPAGKVHFLHFRTLDERVTLNKNRKRAGYT